MILLKPLKARVTRQLLPGYLDLRAQLPPFLAQQLPLHLAQPEIGLVRIFLGTSVAYEKSVKFFGPGHWLKPVRIFTFYPGQAWCHAIYHMAAHWPREWLPVIEQSKLKYLLSELGAILTFYPNGQLRLNFARETSAAHYYADGQWKSISEEVTIDAPENHPSP